MFVSWPNCGNARDLAGIRIRAGRIRPGRLIRSDNLDQLTPAGLSEFRAARISRVVDLRSEWECRTFPSPIADEPIWLNVPLSDVDDPDESHHDLVTQYCLLLDRAHARVGAAVAAIADAPAGNVVAACHAGKDRTGVIIAVTLSALGADDASIADDYALTPVGMSEHAAARQPHQPGSGQMLPELAAPRRETIVAMLKHVRARYDSVTDFLGRAGVAQSQLDRIAGRLTAEATP